MRIQSKIYLFFCLFSVAGSLVAQPLYPYWDQFNKHFNIYDNGQIRTLETNQPKSFKSSANYCAYVTDVYDFKLYANGKSQVLSKFLPKNYDCSDALVAWNTGVSTFVYTNGNVRKLCDACSNLQLNDSMLQFVDRYGYFSVYYNNKIRTLEINEKVEFRLGRNLIAFVDRNNLLKVWFHDVLTELDYFGDSSFYACGLNTVGYIDHSKKLKVFYNNQTFTLDKLPPKKFIVGDNMVAWVDQNNNFKLFHKGNIFILENYEPEAFNVIEGVVFYKSAQNEFKVFEGGKGKVIETYYPSKIDARNNTLVYMDFRDRLKAYIEGTSYNVSEDIIKSYKIFTDLIAYSSNAKSLTFWNKGDKIEIQVN